MTSSNKEGIEQTLHEQAEINDSYKQSIYGAGEVYTLEAKRAIARQVVQRRLGHEDEELVEQLVAYLLEEEEEHPT